jgi:hypothetical protein
MFHRSLLLIAGCSCATLAAYAGKGEGYLAVEAQYGRVFWEGDKDFHASWGGWILGGEDEWRGGAGAMKLYHPYYSSNYGSIDFWLAGPIVYYVPNPKDDAIIHIGGEFGMGSAKSDLAASRQWFAFVEPKLMVAFKLAGWMGIGIHIGYRYIRSQKTDPSMIDTLSHSVNAGASFIMGEF